MLRCLNAKIRAIQFKLVRGESELQKTERKKERESIL